jgi:beta-glucosidase
MGKGKSAFSMTIARAILFISACVAYQAFSQTPQYPFLDPSLPLEDRIANVISLLTQTEKVQLLASSKVSNTRLGFSTTPFTEGYHGAALGGPSGWSSNSTPATQFCQAYGMGETWDPGAIEKALGAEAAELRYAFHKGLRSGLVVLAPNCDIGRDPRWGRTEECFGEDPFLAGTLTQAAVRGLQGNDPKYLQCASLMKHFFANSNENSRTSSNSVFDQRLLREYYTASFRMGTEAGAECMMAAYNKVNGVPCAVQPALRSMGRKDFGMSGIICTDGGALGMLVTDHRYFQDTATAAYACIKAGISAFLDRYTNGINSALGSNMLKIADIDSALTYNFEMWFRLGLLDPPDRVPYTNVGSTEPWTTDAHKSICRLVTQKSIVLLKNSGTLLPLDKKTIKSIAVIGENADSVCLDWYSGTPAYKVSALAGIRNKVPSGVTVNYAQTNTDSAAIKAARASDVALVVVGNHPLCHNVGWGICQKPSEGREQKDRDSITFEPGEESLIRQVFSANPNTIVLILSGFPYAAHWAKENVPAIIHMTHNSQELGNALADVLFGDYNPAGRTTQTWVASLKDLPDMMDYNIRNGRTYMYFDGTPLWPFGYGLSYTTFNYADLRTSEPVLDGKSSITVSVDITNTGKIAGEEVVQMYVKHLSSGVVRPIKELRGFERVALAAGETRTVTMPLSGRHLAYWDSVAGTWTVECDKVEIQVGASSADIRLYDTLPVTNCGPIDMSEVKAPYDPDRLPGQPAIPGVRLIKKAGLIEAVFRNNESGLVDLRVYSLTGETIGHWAWERMIAGDHRITFRFGPIPPGVYILALQAGGRHYVSKCWLK